MPIDRSAGYKGTVKDKQWAGMISHVGSSLHGVASPTDWAPSIAPGDRAVKISAGIGWGLGVQDEMDDDHTVNLDPITSGTQRWDMIVCRRAWIENTGGTSAFAVIKGGTARELPARSVGFPLDDQPVALCRVGIVSGSSVLTDVVNLNVVPGTDALWAVDDLARAWLDEVGTNVRIGSSLWRLDRNLLGTPVWRCGPPIGLYSLAVTGLPDTGGPYSAFAVTAVEAETTDASFVLSQTGSVFALKRGVYQVTATITSQHPFTGRTFVQIQRSGLSANVARNNSQVGEDTVTVSATVHVTQDGQTVTIGYFKNTSTVNNHTGRVTIARLP